jgi:hypothetical protein
MATDTTRRRRQKGRAGDHSYLGIPHYILRSPEFGALEPWSLKLLIELAGNYNGKNNGDLSAAYSVLRVRGWRSAGTLNNAIKSLVAGRWIVYARHGGRNRCALFALTWWPIDCCEGKWLELRAETVARHSWKTDSVVSSRTNVVSRRTNDDLEDAPCGAH